MSCLVVCSWLPSVQTCCCCHSLGLGSKLIGWSLLVFSLLDITGAGLSLGGQGGGVTLGSLSMSYGVLTFIGSILLLIGLYCETPILVKVWIILEFVILILMLVTIILTIVYVSEGKDGKNHYMGSSIASLLLEFAIRVYFFIVVYSYFTGS